MPAAPAAPPAPTAAEIAARNQQIREALSSRHEIPPSAALDERTRANLQNLHADLVAYARVNGNRFPASLDALQSEFLPDPGDLRNPDSQRLKYVYVPGQRTDSPGDNVLAYDPTDLQVGGHAVFSVLRVDGAVTTAPSLAAVRAKVAQQLIPPPPPTPSPLPKVAARLPAPAAQNNPTPPGSPTPPAPATPPQPPVRPTHRPAASKPVPPVTWDAGWPDAKVPEDHPFWQACKVIKEIKIEGRVALAGVDFGEKAKGPTDDVYAKFKRAASAQFDQFTAAEGGMGERKDIKQKIGQVEYDRIIATKGLKTLTVYTGVENGHCVCYWFAGSPSCLGAFIGGLGKANLTSP
jgi:hypothetical protein